MKPLAVSQYSSLLEKWPSAHSCRTAFPDELQGILGRQGLAKQKALHEVALMLDQVVALGFGFNPFRGHFQAEVVRQGQGGSADLGIIGVSFDIADEGPVELQHLDRQAFEVGEGGIASAEVVDG